MRRFFLILLSVTLVSAFLGRGGTEAVVSPTFNIGAPNSAPFGAAWQGFGVELDPMWFWPPNSSDEANWAMQMGRLNSMNIKFVRMMSQLEWATTDPDLLVWDWTTTQAKGLLRYLDWAQANGVSVMLTEWGWAVNGPPDHIYATPTDIRYAQGVAKMLKNLIVTRGYTCIKWLIVGNEPDNEMVLRYSMNDYETCQRNVHAQLIAEGVHDLVKFVLPDSGGHWDYMEDGIHRMFDIADAYDFHRYAEWNETSNLGLAGPWEMLWYNIDVQRQYAVNHDPNGMTKPMLITEAGKPSGSTQFGPPEINAFIYALHMADYGVTALTSRTNGLIAWNAFDLQYFGYLEFTWGMWKDQANGFALKPWVHAWSLLATHAPPNSVPAQINGTPPTQPDVSPYRVGAVLRPDGLWSIFLVNRSADLATYTLNFTTPPTHTLYSYRLDSGTYAAHPNNVVVQPSGFVDVASTLLVSVPADTMIVLAESEVSASATPFRTPTATLAPTGTAIPTATVSPSMTPTPMMTAEPTVIATPTPTVPAKAISGVTMSASVPAYGKQEIAFKVDNSVATNYDLPYEAAPPPGVPAGVGVSVTGEFSRDGFATVLKQPAFHYQDFEYQVKSGQDWFYPTDNFKWMLRFAPPGQGVWQFRIRAQDAAGEAVSQVYSFVATASTDKGFIRVSPKDSRYFEFEDGTYFPATGYNQTQGEFSWDNPIQSSLGNVAKMGQNGVQLARIWLAQWGIYGSINSSWESIPGGMGYGSLTNTIAAPRSDMSMVLVRKDNPSQALGLWKQGPAIKAGRLYKVAIKYRIPQALPPPLDQTKPYGLVAKIGDWYPDVYRPGVGTVVTGHASATTGDSWATLEGQIDTGRLPADNLGSDFLRRFYLVMENVDHSVENGEVIAIDKVEIKEDLGGGSYGPNIVSRPSMDYPKAFDQKYSYSFDKLLDQVERNGVYLKVTVMEKNDFVLNCYDQSGRPTLNCSNDYAYGDYRNMTRNRWYEQAWWRYVQARWGYSTHVHSWELLNEGDPNSTRHFALADEFGKFMHRWGNRHLVTTSFWHSFPKSEFWANPAYPDVDYADIHKYVFDTDPDFNDSAAAAINLSAQIGARTPGGTNKPTMRGETGFVESGNTDNFTRKFEKDVDGIWLHKYVWSQLNAGGVIESYWYARQHIYPSLDHRNVFKPFYDFVQTTPPNNGFYADLGATSPNAVIRVVGQKDSANGKALLWVDNRNHTWRNVVDGVPIVSESGSVSFPMPIGAYAVTWVDPYTGFSTGTESLASDGTLTLTVTNLLRDVAARVTSLSASPTLTPTMIPTWTPVPQPTHKPTKTPRPTRTPRG